MKEPYDEIIQLLDSAKVPYEISTHGRAVTSHDTVRQTGFDIRSGAKSIVFKDKTGFKLVVVRGDNVADFKKLRAHFGTNKLRLATPEEVKLVMRVEIGACYPFGQVAGVPMIVDATLSEREKIHFSPGTHFEHITMRFADYAHVATPKLIDIAIAKE